MKTMRYALAITAIILHSSFFILHSAAAAPVQTVVSVESQPAGASVIIDGMDRGTTPIAIYDLKPGRHHLKYRLAGYEERDRFFKTGEEPRISRSETLNEVRGILLVKSEPEGADIKVDGVSVGRTPRLITHLAAKDVYQVKLVKSGYLDQVISVKFDGRKPLVREEKLVLASGTLNVLSEPAGAEVTVNGIGKGVTPIEVTDVPKGRATVKFTLNGYEEEIRELQVKAGDVQTLSVPMKGLPGTLRLTSVPDGARFYVNDEPKGKGPVVMTGLKPGEFRVRVELEGYGPQEKTVALENGASQTEEFRLSNVMGSIEVKTTPPGAQVFLDGKPAGVTRSRDPDGETSDMLLLNRVLEGDHVLVARKDGYAEAVRHLKVAQQKASQVNFRLKRLFIPDVEIVTAEVTYRGVLVKNGVDGMTIETKPGISQTIPREKIRKIEFLTDKKKEK